MINFSTVLQLINRPAIFFSSRLLYPFCSNPILVRRDAVSAGIYVRPRSFDKYAVWENWRVGQYLSPKHAISPNSIIVDIGAHIGSFAILAAKRAYRGRILAFEPHPENFRLLQKNIRFNHCSNIQALPYAVTGNGSSKSADLFIYPAHNGGHSLVHKVGSSSITVPTITLPQIFSRYRLSRIDLLKIDAEGSEFDILLNCPDKTLAKIHSISLEFHDHVTPFNSFDLVFFLTRHRFKVSLSRSSLLDPIIFKTGKIKAVLQ